MRCHALYWGGKNVKLTVAGALWHADRTKTYTCQMDKISWLFCYRCRVYTTGKCEKERDDQIASKCTLYAWITWYAIYHKQLWADENKRWKRSWKRKYFVCFGFGEMLDANCVCIVVLMQYAGFCTHFARRQGFTCIQNIFLDFREEFFSIDKLISLTKMKIIFIDYDFFEKQRLPNHLLLLSHLSKAITFKMQSLSVDVV